IISDGNSSTSTCARTPIPRNSSDHSLASFGNPTPRRRQEIARIKTPIAIASIAASRTHRTSFFTLGTTFRTLTYRSSINNSTAVRLVQTNKCSRLSGGTARTIFDCAGIERRDDVEIPARFLRRRHYIPQPGVAQRRRRQSTPPTRSIASYIAARQFLSQQA